MTEAIKALVDWPHVITQWQRSGLDKKAFCIEQQINYKTFLKHCKRQPEIIAAASLANNLASPPLPPFIPVQLKSPADNATPPPLSLILSKRFKVEIPVESAQGPLLNALFKALGVLA